MTIQQLPDYYQPPQQPVRTPGYVPPVSPLTRPTAKQITDAQRQVSITLPGYNRVIPFIYGETRVNGLWLVRPYTVVSGVERWRCAILWSEGGNYGIQGIPSVYLNGQAVSSSHMTHYLGAPGQTPNSMLAGDIPGFNDSYEGLAYTVFDIPAATYDGFPDTRQFEAVVQGIKVYDPRTLSYTFSKNPALCFADWAQSTVYGPGLSVSGVAACADRCDSFVGGVEIRCEMGHAFSQPLDLDATANLFAAYGEFLWSFDGASFLVVPDAPVAAPLLTVDADHIIEKTLKLTGVGLDRSPTEITGTYRASSGGAAQWPQESETVALAGVDVGEVQAILSDVVMPGIRRGSEMKRKITMRLRRLQHPGRWAWQMFDPGVKFQRGDVVQLPDLRGMSDRVVRIMSAEMIGNGKHQITAEFYSASMYPDDYEPGETTTVPVGGILPYIGNDTPAGYSDFTAANGRMLVGAGSTWARGATFGSTAFTVSGETSTQAAHGPGLAPYNDERPFFTGNFSQFMRFYVPAGGHAHTYSVAQNREPEFVQTKLIVKTGTPGDVPANAGFWADGAIISSAYEALSTHLGRLHKAGTTNTQGGSQPTYSLNLGLAPAGAHNHLGNNEAGFSWDIDFTNVKFSHLNAPAHSHASSIPVTMSIPRMRLAHYVAGSGFEIVPGAIIGFNGDGALPPGWYDADGSNGTYDTRDFWPERSSPGDAGAKIAGTRQVVWSGTTAAGGAHSHKGSQTNIGRIMTDTPHDNDNLHTHTVSGAVPYDPPSYAMRFIQYTGVI